MIVLIALNQEGTVRVNRIESDGGEKPNKSRAGRKSKVAWLRTTRAGKEAIATFLQYLTAGASLSASSAMLGVSAQTVDRWIRQGKEGLDADSVWFVETIQEAISRSVANAEVRVYKSKPLDWLRYSPTSKANDSGWQVDRSSGKENDREGKGNEGGSLIQLSQENKLSALYELRKAGLDLNTLIDSQLSREYIVDNTIADSMASPHYLSQEASVDKGTGRILIHESQYTNHNSPIPVHESNTRNIVRGTTVHELTFGPGVFDGGRGEVTRGAAPSGGTPVEYGPNDTNHNLNPHSNHVNATNFSPSHASNTHYAPNTNPHSNTNPTFDSPPNQSNYLTLDPSVHSLGTPGRSGTNWDSGTPTPDGSNQRDGTPNRPGTNHLGISEYLDKKILKHSGDDDTIQGRIAAILASGRARASLSARKE